MKRNLKELAIQAGLLIRTSNQPNAIPTAWTQGDAVCALERFVRLVEGKESIEDIRSKQATRVIDRGINIVTCGECGEPFVVSLSEEEHTCPFCNMSGDPCDFPDLFH